MLCSCRTGKIFLKTLHNDTGEYCYSKHRKGFHKVASLWYPLTKTKNQTSQYNLMKTAGGVGAERREEGESQHEMGEVYRFLMVHPDPQKTDTRQRNGQTTHPSNYSNLGFGKSLIRDKSVDRMR